MSIFDSDQKAMLEVYLYETNSLFEQLDTILLETEKKASFTSEDIHYIFRIMHTTKSSSSMMGLEQIATLMHTVEDLFSLFRDEPDKLNGNEKETFDLLFDISDFMHDQLDTMQCDDFEPKDATMFINRTKDLLVNIHPKTTEDKKEDTKPVVNASNKGVYVRVQFEKDARMENIRAYMVASQIKSLCTTLEYYPNSLEQNASAAEVIQKNGFLIHFEAEDHKQVLQVLHRALFVESCEIIDKNEYIKIVHGEQKPKQEKEEKIKEQPPVNTEVSSLIPVHVRKLDQLHNLTGELMISESVIMNRMKELDQKELIQLFERNFHKILLDMEEIVMSARLVPIAQIVPKLNRVVRDICHKENKEVTFTVIGEDIEIDKGIVDNLFDPLMHLLRNAVDHGIETKEERIAMKKSEVGEIILSIGNANGEIVIHVSDDGRGLNAERIKEKAKEKKLLKPEKVYTQEEIYAMILLPGFSTNNIANEFSGRGVGMDVVKNMADRFKGHVTIQSTYEKGTRFTIHLPLTLTIIESMIFCCGNTTFSIPAHNVIQFFPYHEDDPKIQRENGHFIYVDKNKAIPIIELERLFHIETEKHEASRILMCVASSNKQVCILVDNITAYQHIVDKPLPPLMGTEFKKSTGISGCSLLGDGSICMSLNMEYLLNSELFERCVG